MANNKHIKKSILDDGNVAQEYGHVEWFRIEYGKGVEDWENAEPVLENDVNSGKF